VGSPARPRRAGRSHRQRPLAAVDREAAGQILALDLDKLQADARRFWTRVVYGPGQITTPDPFVNDYVTALRARWPSRSPTAIRRSSGTTRPPERERDVLAVQRGDGPPTFDLRGLTSMSGPSQDVHHTQDKGDRDIPASRRRDTDVRVRWARWA